MYILPASGVSAEPPDVSDSQFCESSVCPLRGYASITSSTYDGRYELSIFELEFSGATPFAAPRTLEFITSTLLAVPEALVDVMVEEPPPTDIATAVAPDAIPANFT